ncbi:hypothetical protein PVK06_020110 [Gossypium arboreum]|uniref:Uncharacterized protein n=1 Tax=Gossypium arboreum TaxID=29729 RepID=A0ABR0PLY2_GOSAR|nr:hypothetical protein PVK06_020110 [Gossypium arboreum]
MFAPNPIFASSPITDLEHWLQLNGREGFGTTYTIGYELVKDHIRKMLGNLWAINDDRAEYLYNIPFKQWTQFYDRGLRYGHMMTNLTECISPVLKGTHHFPVTSVVKET